MKILCLGDSVTWGAKEFGVRYKKEERWTTMLGENLGEGYTIFEDGLCGREAGMLEEEAVKTRGFLYKTIMRYYPFDVLILMLGITDMREVLHNSAEHITESIGALARAILGYNYEIGSPPKIVIASPPHIQPGVATTKDAYIYGLREDAVEKSKQLAPLYKKLADELGLYFFDVAECVGEEGISDYDRIHLNDDGHKMLAAGLAAFIKNTNFKNK